jgi:hypothetical protein
VQTGSEPRELQSGRYFRCFRRWRIVSASFSCGDRPVTSRTPPLLLLKSNPQACTGRLGEALSVEAWSRRSPAGRPRPASLPPRWRPLPASCRLRRALMTAEATVNSCSSASWAATNSGPGATPARALGGMYVRLSYLLRPSQGRGAFAHLTLSETRQHELCLSERWTFAFQ